MKTTIRPATINDSKKLTEISFESKRYWRYSEAYIRVWEKELTVTPTYIENNDVWVFEQDGEPVAYYSVIKLDADAKFSGCRLRKGYWLDHMFVIPGCIGSGIGSRLYCHMCDWCRKQSISEIHLLSDPNARGFYEKMGACYCGEFPSTISGRTTPMMVIIIDNASRQLPDG